MKTPARSKWIPGLVLAMAWLPGGMAQNETHRTSFSAPDKTLFTIPKEISSPPVITLPAHVAARDTRPLSKVHLSPWANEIVKLAEARLEDDVVLSFIENSGTFSLGADQIVYLSDLGVSSQVITAMLQHDQDLISGVKPLTVASEPSWESELPASIATRTEISREPGSQAPANVAVPAPASMEFVDGAKPASSPIVAWNTSQTLPAVLQYAMTDEPQPAKASAPGRHQSADKKRSPYPVREPYPVELTSPIIFIEAPERTPNTIIIVGFPRSSH